MAAPTVKPQNVLVWLCELLVRPGALVLDPFAGSGAVTEAVLRASAHVVSVERDPAYVALILHRLDGLGVQSRLSRD